MLSAAQVERAVALYESGLSLKAVAKELGADWRVVTRALRDAGVVIRRSRRSVLGTDGDVLDVAVHHHDVFDAG